MDHKSRPTPSPAVLGFLCPAFRGRKRTGRIIQVISPSFSSVALTLLHSSVGRRNSSNPCDRIHQDSAGCSGGPGTGRHNLGTRHRRASGTANRGLCEKRTVVGAAMARQAVHPHTSRLYLEHGNSSRIRIRGDARRADLSSSSHHGRCAYNRRLDCFSQNGEGHGCPELAPVKIIHFGGYDWKVRHDCQRSRRNEQSIRWQ